ncbi:MAG: hypothetical protein P8X96_15345, partial [Desulfobacteraceae bacterium]
QRPTQSGQERRSLWEPEKKTQPYSDSKVPEYEAKDIRELIEKPCRIIHCANRTKSYCRLALEQTGLAL